MKPNITISDWGLARAVGGEITVGSAFAFVSTKALAHPSLAWVGTLLGDSGRGPFVIPLDPRGTAIPSALVKAHAPARLLLRAIASDKALYQEKRDAIHLCVVEPSAADMELTIEVRQGETTISKHRVKLDAHGCGHVVVRDLPAGEYTAQFRGQKEAPCSFSVAEYRLAPLVARLVDRRLAKGTLEAVIGLTSFGEPVEGAVEIELSDRGRRLSRIRVDAREGRAEARLSLEGEGPHELALQLVADPSRTATIPIVGSRAAERSETTFSELGTVVTGTLLPRDGARDVRGIWLSEGAIATTPIRLSEVVTKTARFSAATAIDGACFVVVDPTFPEKRANAIDPATSHPAHDDPKYVKAEQLFKEKRYQEAGDLFLEGRTASKTAHPNYAYYIACCDALSGNREAARRWLYEAIRDGWNDFAHMATDPDLASLRGWEPYETLARGGRKVITKGRMEAGETIEIDVAAPLGIVLCGAIVEGQPWEGWAAVVAPSELSLSATAPEAPKPGSRVRIEIAADRPASVYAIVKDARLLSADTPASRLAAAAKAYVEDASKKLEVGRPRLTLESAAPPPTFAGGFSEGSFGGGLPPPGGMRGGVVPVMAVNPPPPMMAQPPMALRSPSPAGMGRPAPAMPMQGAPPPPMAAPSPYRDASPPPASLPEEEPEVLFAGIVALEGGRGTVDVALPDTVADYVVEVFGLSGLDWVLKETRFRAAKPTFVALDLPPFVHPADLAIGRLHVGTASASARVRVTRDGADLPLVYEGNPLGPSATLAARHATLSFLAGPGEYEAVVEEANGASDRTRLRVDVPGKLRRQVRALRLLTAGERIARSDDPSIVQLKVLPGLDKPFTALVDATADYGHACCEQTAAKMLSACAMYLFANGDGARRSTAESIILAGVRRERSMWLQGRGFKMYPDSGDRVDSYWGPKAARYLFQLALLEKGASGTLREGIAEAIKMADDAARAYEMEWPPKRPQTCEEAFALARFGNASADVLGYVDERQRNLMKGAAVPGGAVALRAELAYAAATLFCAGKGAHHKNAIDLANKVTTAFGEAGRLYSTVDSVAAIALMTALTESGIATGAGKVEIDGKAMTTNEAVAYEGAIDRVAVTEGLCPVEVTKWVEEDWSTLRGDVTMRLSLEKNGTPARSFAPLDAVDLRIKLVDGYKPGDLAWVCLPSALTRVVGGGQVKRFSVDFEGKDEIVIPLAATSVTVGKNGPAPQHFAACVRNMFEEERGASAGLVEIMVADNAPNGVLARALAGLKGLFS